METTYWTPPIPPPSSDTLSFCESREYATSTGVILSNVIVIAVVMNMVSVSILHQAVRQVAQGGSGSGSILYTIFVTGVYILGLVLAMHIFPYAEHSDTPSWMGLFGKRKSDRKFPQLESSHVAPDKEDSYSGVWPLHWSLPSWCHAIVGVVWVAMAVLLIQRIPFAEPIAILIGSIWLLMALFSIHFFAISPILIRTRFRTVALAIPITVTCAPDKLEVSVGGWRTRYDIHRTTVQYIESCENGVILTLGDNQRKGFRSRVALALHRETALQLIAHIRSIQSGEVGSGQATGEVAPG